MNQAIVPSIPSINYAPEQYQQLWLAKHQRISHLLDSFNPPAPECFDSPVSHFRMRAEFRIWHDWSTETGQCNYVMFEKDQPKVPVKVSNYAIGNQAITELMQPLIDCLNQSQALKHKLFQIEFLSTSTNEVLVSLIYHRQLDDNWQQAATKLEQDFGIQVIGRAKKQRLVISRDYVTEKLIINQQAFYYQQQENSFTQPNAAINCKMIEWVCSHLSDQENRDLLELYCGNGNFTIPLAQKFKKVLATEVSKSSIKLAQENCGLNNSSNIEFIRLSSDETASALKQEREFRRLKHIEISDYDFSTVLVDPPRAGLDSNTLALVSGFETIIYISCNPITLSANLETLSQTHKIERFALFDQFPYTDHCECGMILVRKINDQ